MDGKLLLTVCVVLVLSCYVHAQRGSGRVRGGNRQRRPITPPEGDRYTWSRDLGDGVSVEEAAFVPNDTNIVLLRSFDDNLRARNYSKGSTLYDFTTPDALVVIGIFGPCFVTNTNLTFQAVVDELAARNGSSVNATELVYLDGTMAPLSLPETEALFTTNPAVRRACRDGRVVITVPLGANPTPFTGETENVVVSVLDAAISITIQQRPRRNFFPGQGFGRPAFPNQRFPGQNPPPFPGQNPSPFPGQSLPPFRGQNPPPFPGQNPRFPGQSLAPFPAGQVNPSTPEASTDSTTAPTTPVVPV
ncbi:uncharacterized protein LOC131933259 [Physella acuta]|uniref:uncharacterized protein LOC131933259 n=1 Tax=Physella acuta TaxID=109671 RepID=UPI0027DDA463|nr:uncharacterized protein LOC131933259 [Physella acuta]